MLTFWVSRKYVNITETFLPFTSTFVINNIYRIRNQYHIYSINQIKNNTNHVYRNKMKILENLTITIIL
jgi:hypothetical protein